MKYTKTKVFLLSLIVGIFGIRASFVHAQTSLAQEEAQGKALAEQLQSKSIAVASLTDDQFELVGEYLMGLMIGPGHEAMNQSLVARYGEAGERQMHINMAKQFLGYQLPQNTYGSSYGYGFMPMMGNWGNGGYSGMTGGGFGYPATSDWSWGYSMMGGISSLLWIIILILVVIGLVKWLAHQSHH